VSVVLGRLARDLGRYDPADGALVAAAVLDLVTAALSGAPGTAPAANRHDSLRQEILAFIDARLGQPDLSPATIAAEHHISTRLLHKLFEGAGATVIPDAAHFSRSFRARYDMSPSDYRNSRQPRSRDRPRPLSYSEQRIDR
jgi:AraC-like DNA-binding protein